MFEMENVERLKEILRNLDKMNVDEAKSELRRVLKGISPLQIAMIEQSLVAEGLPVKRILELCDLHVELFREFLRPSALRDVPSGHPLDLLLRENEYIVGLAEKLNVLLSAAEREQVDVEALRGVLRELKGIRVHYRKLQMLVFPYLERLGLSAIPRVLWGKEDGVLKGVRELLSHLDHGDLKHVIEKGKGLPSEIIDIAFRENSILFPTVWALLRDGEWAVVKEIGNKMGYLVEADSEWAPSEEPRLPYQLVPSELEERLAKLPPDVEQHVGKGIAPDDYVIVREGDLDIGTGFADIQELKGVLKALPVELTFANADGRIRFFTESEERKGFVRTRTIIGRNLAYCHPPRLEKYVMLHVNLIRQGKLDRKTFWTTAGGRIIRVIIAAVKDDKGKLLGILEIVEDLTEIVENPEKIKEKIMIL